MEFCEGQGRQYSLLSLQHWGTKISENSFLVEGRKCDATERAGAFTSGLTLRL